MSEIRVLVVEDEPIAAAAHAAYIERLDGFTLAGSAPDGQSAVVCGNVKTANATVQIIDTVLMPPS